MVVSVVLYESVPDSKLHDSLGILIDRPGTISSFNPSGRSVNIITVTVVRYSNILRALRNYV